MTAAELRAATRRAIVVELQRVTVSAGIPAYSPKIEAAIDAEIAAARPQWQPIETAPRDGGCVLLSAYGLSGASEPAFWHDGSENYWKREGWYAEGDRQNLLTAKPLLGFDLYMPLPETPQPPP